MPKAPDFSKAKTPAERKQAQEDFEKEKKSVAKDNKARAETEKRQLRTAVHLYAPKAPGKEGPVAIKVLFANGDSLVKERAYVFTKPDARDAPKIEKITQVIHDPVSTLGFWLLLLVGGAAFLCVGYLLGIVAPGGGSKQPLAAGFIGWMVIQIFLILLGISGNALIFALFVGGGLDIGMMILGSAIADKTADVA
jgi:hypothetical protein